jgi:hypothetical protein
LVDRAVSRPAGRNQSLVLRLDARSGDSTLGWKLAPLAHVPLAEADLHLNSWDCGARGRWVQVRSSKGLEFCASTDATNPSTTTCFWNSSFDVGGSDTDSIKKTVWVRRGRTPVGQLKLLRTTTLAPEWYLESPIAPFEVELQFVADAQ